MSQRGIAVLILLVGFVVSVGGSGFLLTLLREDLHFQCSFLQMGAGDPGSFFCADGISYIGVAVSANGAHVVILLIALGIAMASPDTAGMQSRLMAFCSILPVAMFSWLTWDGTQHRPVDQAPDVNYWLEPLLPVTGVLCVAVVVILAAGILTPPRLRMAGCLLAMALLVVAVFVQLGSLSAVALALGALAAAMVLETRLPTEVDSPSSTPYG